MRKLLLLLLIPSALFAQPKSIHYSANGDYLVDENGNRTTIEGHPHLTCYVGDEEIHGVYEKIRVIHPGVVLYMHGWSKMGFEETGKKKIYPFALPNPVCDIEQCIMPYGEHVHCSPLMPRSSWSGCLREAQEQEDEWYKTHCGD